MRSIAPFARYPDTAELSLQDCPIRTSMHLGELSELSGMR